MKLFILPSLTSPDSERHVHINCLHRFTSEITCLYFNKQATGKKKKDPDFRENKVIYPEPAARVDGTQRNGFVPLNCHQGSK